MHKESTGRDNLAVGWQLPNGTLQRPMPTSSLSPFDINYLPNASITSPANGFSTVAPANITINANANDIDGTICNKFSKR